MADEDYLVLASAAAICLYFCLFSS